MKALLAGLGLFIIILLIVSAGYITVDNGSGKTEKPWNNTDDSFSGAWGSEIKITYIDGTTESLNMEPLFALPFSQVNFNNKQVSLFEYILSFQASSTTSSVVDIDLSDFSIAAKINGKSENYGTPTVYSTTGLPIDDQWHIVYTHSIPSSVFESFEEDYSYNLTLTPSGSAKYNLGDGCKNIPLPNWYYINFQVKSDVDDIVPGDKYIEVVLTGDDGE